MRMRIFVRTVGVDGVLGVACSVAANANAAAAVTVIATGSRRHPGPSV